MTQDLDPFTQGYIQALFETDLHPPSSAAWGQARHLRLYALFSDLSPEALELILKDCAAFQAAMPDMCKDALNGKVFWLERRNHEWPEFPPLTVTLEDGKVYLKGPQ